MARSDLLLIGDEEARVLFETDDDEESFAAAQALGTQVVVLKRGALGAWGSADGVRAEVAAPPVVAVDPVGAGDGFDAGFLAAWLRGEGLVAALDLGARVGAAAVAQMGDYAGYPRIED
jgi:2-dehydro-3-deoxygluconokinase